MMNASARPHSALRSSEEAAAALTAPGALFELDTATVRGQRLRIWRNAPATFRDAFLTGEAHGDTTFLVLEGERISFDAFGRAVRTLADEFVSAGLRPGDRVAIAMRNLPQWPVAFFAAILAGGIATPLNAWWTGSELGYGLRDCDARILIADSERLERVAGDRDALSARIIYRIGDYGEGRDLNDVIGESARWSALRRVSLPNLPLAPDDDATLFYTSGTAGYPKGAIGSHRNLLTTLMTNAYFSARAAFRAGESGGETRRVLLLSVPFFHILGCAAHLIPALVGGMKLVLMHRWEIAEGLRLIESEGVTDAGGVPANAIDLLDHARKSGRNLASLTGISYGGAPSKPDLAEELRTAFPGVRPATGWGMTETSGGVCAQIGAEVADKPGRCGAAAPVWDMKVVDEDGNALPPGAVGELLVRGPGMARGYWNQPEASEATFGDGWVRTGDLATIDTEGVCAIVDRAKDVIIRGGENIYSVEVENVLLAHPAVAEAALLPRPHRILGEEPVAVVRLKPKISVTEAELRAHAASRLAAFKLPVAIQFRNTPFPRNATGKIVKADLKGKSS